MRVNESACGSERALEYLGHQAAKTSASLFEFAHIDAVQFQSCTFDGRKLVWAQAIEAILTHQDIIWGHGDAIGGKGSGLRVIEFDDFLP